jgi:hypothetical protein
VIVNKTCLSLSLSLSLRGGVTRQGVVLTDLQSLLDCEYKTSLSLSLSLYLQSLCALSLSDSLSLSLSLWDGMSPVSHPTCDVPFPPRRTGEYWKGMISARPLDRRRSGPFCVLPKGVPQGQTESGGIVLAVICWSPSAQRRCDPTGRCAD